MEQIFTINQEAKSEIMVKRSKFIAEAFYVQTEKEAEKKINEIRKREHSARHHCYAFRVLEDDLIQRMSDDGEPSGTAGNPMLSILQGRELTNTLVVVTRYFGRNITWNRRTSKGIFRCYSRSDKKSWSEEDV